MPEPSRVCGPGGRSTASSSGDASCGGEACGRGKEGKGVSVFNCETYPINTSYVGGTFGESEKGEEGERQRQPERGGTIGLERNGEERSPRRGGGGCEDRECRVDSMKSSTVRPFVSYYSPSRSSENPFHRGSPRPAFQLAADRHPSSPVHGAVAVANECALR